MFGPSPLSSPTAPPCASNEFPVTLVFPVMKMRIYLPKLVPPCPLTQFHALSPSRCQSPLFLVPLFFLFFQYDWRRHISRSFMNHQVPEFSSEELLLSRLICCELSRLCCHGCSHAPHTDGTACKHYTSNKIHNHILFHP